MKLLVFQHHADEHPGALRALLARDGVDWQAIELDAGEPIPHLSGYDALWVLGGPMDVWDVDDHPWLVAEKAAIRRWVVDLGKPFLGICLGHQLLADALGGACAPQVEPEIGIYDIELTAEGRQDALFGGLPATQKCLQWHGVRVAQPPDGAVVLAASAACPIQAMRFGERAWSMQYHVEVEADTVDNWVAIPEYRDALIGFCGSGGLERMRTAASENMADFQRSAGCLYDNFMRLAQRQGRLL